MKLEREGVRLGTKKKVRIRNPREMENKNKGERVLVVESKTLRKK